MRILLDENTSRGLRRLLTGNDIRTAPEMGWAAYSNGQLLDEAEKAAFDALVTCDQKPCFSTESHRPKYSRRDPFDQYLAIIAPSPRGYSAPWPTPSRGYFQSLVSAASADSGQLSRLKHGNQNFE
jgi:hypothetical protein